MRIAKSKTLRLVKAATSLGLAVVLAACAAGRSSSTSTTTTTRVSAEQAVAALRASALRVCDTTRGGEAPGIRVAATSHLILDCPRASRGISVFAFDGPDVAFAVAGGGITAGDDVWLTGDLAVAGVGLTPAETSSFDKAMRSLGAHRYQGA